MQRLVFILFFLSITILSGRAFSADELVVRKSIQVYEKPDSESQVIQTLEPGEQVPISSNPDEWRKVKVYSGGKARLGYVNEEDLDGSRVIEKNSRKKNASTTYHQHFSLGVSLIGSYNMQPGWTYTDTNGIVDVNTMSGTVFYFGFFGDYPYSDKTQVRGFVNFRQSLMSGSAKARALPGVTVADTPIKRTQTFLSLGGDVKFYLSKNGNFWYGLGGEMARASTVNLVLGETATQNLEVALPIFLIVNTHIGYDFEIMPSWYLLTEGTFGLITNSKPMTYIGEFQLSAAYSF